MLKHVVDRISQFLFARIADVPWNFSSGTGGSFKANSILHSVDNELFRKAEKEMCNLEKILEEQLTRHFSLQFNIRQYEEIEVTSKNGETNQMSRIGQIKLLNPQTVSISFAENPTAIKAAKQAIEESSLGVTPQQEGLSLFIKVPKITRQRREQLADVARKKLLNDYKIALNEVTDATMKIEDEKRRTETALLSLKRHCEAIGVEKLNIAVKNLLKEVS
uniref:Ribosome-recycling factor, mitochondrial n=1 Tax=Syphacia muris TaxID=451379 RepID=A0A0N5AP88_9BILA